MHSYERTEALVQSLGLQVSNELRYTRKYIKLNASGAHAEEIEMHVLSLAIRAWNATPFEEETRLSYSTPDPTPAPTPTWSALALHYLAQPEPRPTPTRTS